MPTTMRWRWLAVDVGSLLIACVGAAFIRFGWSPVEHVPGYLVVGLMSAALVFALGTVFGVYRGRFRSCSFDELRNLGYSVAISTALLSTIAIALRETLIPMSAPAVTGLLGLCLMVAARAAVRRRRERRGYPAEAEPVILFGAGEAGEQLARAMHRDPRSPYRAVALLDDAPEKRNLRLEGVPVVGTRTALAATVQGTGARILIVSIARADSVLLNDLAARCEAAGVHMQVLPSVAQLVQERVQIRDVREIDETDLLGRTPVQIDAESIADLLRGQRVLITGAGGSIGSEIARQVHRFAPAELVLLDRDESALHAAQLSINNRALLDTDDLVLADIRDRDRMMQVFDLARPTVVLHAAALKHLPLLEGAPAEAIKTNVRGTQNALDAAAGCGTGLFVNISTDKAANPISVLGYSKLITERITSQMATTATGRFLSVRFGNVLGSRGSVLTTFDHQIRSGGPVTVTHPDVTRYFMTIPEAVLLVLQAAVFGRSGEVLVLDMGEPVRIEDVARRLIRMAGADVEITYTGLRPGEKLAEDLLGGGEKEQRPNHPKISEVPGAPLPDDAIEFDLSADPESLRAQLRRLASVRRSPVAPRS